MAFGWYDGIVRHRGNPEPLYLEVKTRSIFTYVNYKRQTLKNAI